MSQPSIEVVFDPFIEHIPAVTDLQSNLLFITQLTLLPKHSSTPFDGTFIPQRGNTSAFSMMRMMSISL